MKKKFLQDWIPINYEYVLGKMKWGLDRELVQLLLERLLCPEDLKNSLIRDSKKLSENKEMKHIR